MSIEEALERVKRASKNVVDVVVINKDNFIIRSTSGNAAKQMSSLVKVVEDCRAAFKENDELTFMKIRTKKCEYLVVPDEEYMLIGVLN